MKRLQDRVALVFGAGSVGPGWGNGKARAVAYSREGAIVICVDVNKGAAVETVALIAGEGGRAEAHSCDVTSGGEIEALVAATVARHGRIDILHNNVGHAKMGGPPDITEEEWQRELDLNVTGAFLARAHRDLKALALIDWLAVVRAAPRLFRSHGPFDDGWCATREARLATLAAALRPDAASIRDWTAELVAAVHL